MKDARRARRIAEMILADMSFRRIARLEGCSRQTVAAMAGQLRKQTKQRKGKQV